jgi:glycosyltransferase involved in cell wall biosynthesis
MRRTLQGYGVSAPMRVLPTGIPLQAAASGDGARFRARLGIGSARPVLLFVGRIAGEKNIDFLLHMLAALRAQLPEVLLVVAGEGPAAPSLAALAQRLALGDAVRFVGYLERETELQDCYRAADLFVFASRTETQGLVLLEAMAVGLPVAALSVMGTRDILEARQGCIIPPDDPRQFAASVAQLLGDPPRREQLSRQAIAYAGSWSDGALGQRLRTFYGDVVSGSLAGLASDAA